MPRLDDHLHYRIVDVSTIKELAARWYPNEFKKAPLKNRTHRALDDIRESIEELRYYRSSIFQR
uniref:Exonuclease domain-containing protein n=1 Tax=Angiostrongylus cantonensis TaxID=6313 RepID=A0A0K0CWW2_ANGCA